MDGTKQTRGEAVEGEEDEMGRSGEAWGTGEEGEEHTRQKGTSRRTYREGSGEGGEQRLGDRKKGGERGEGVRGAGESYPCPTPSSPPRPLCTPPLHPTRASTLLHTPPPPELRVHKGEGTERWPT